ncbi:MAG: hypothetical protein LBQ75_05095 [Zoogloeaceae bacterium]|jgi:multisubunit Na+/H+ antiporter MnhB subunit|nr:hypothetical protein [Zoogloeaceae bacterium]
MKFLSQESPPGSAALRQSHFNSDGWLRSFAQWFGVGLAHAAFLGTLLYASPPTLQMGMSNVIQAGLIAPRLLDATLETSFAERLSEKPPEKPNPPPSFG